MSLTHTFCKQLFQGLFTSYMMQSLIKRLIRNGELNLQWLVIYICDAFFEDSLMEKTFIRTAFS